jgi:hypothetical protein
MNTPTAPELTLYYRIGCHLCEDMRDALLELQAQQDFRLREIDIDAAADLIARYGTLIPVLCLGEQEICHYFLNPAALMAALQSRPKVG